MIAGRGRGSENERMLTEEERSFEHSLEVRKMDNVNVKVDGSQGRGLGRGEGEGRRLKAARPTAVERSDWPVGKLWRIVIGRGCAASESSLFIFFTSFIRRLLFAAQK